MKTNVENSETAVLTEILDTRVYVLGHSTLTWPIQFPFPPEPHVAAWQEYATTSHDVGVWPTLSKRLIQLQFPIRANISQLDAYKAATRRGVPADGIPEATGLALQQPDRLSLQIYPSIAGAIPLLITPHRADFVSLVQAFTRRNEPAEIPDSMGACMVTGYNNWDRIRTYRAQWEQQPGQKSKLDWQAEFKRLISQKHLYQDRFMILSDGPYSNVAAADLGVSTDTWAHYSRIIRREHETVHYFTKRFYELMRTHVFDELLADYVGIRAAVGRFRANWFLRFMGLEAYPNYREGGRLQNYTGDLAISSDAFAIQQEKVKKAAENLELFDASQEENEQNQLAQILRLLCIMQHTLQELASPNAPLLLQKTLDELRKKQKGHIS